MSVHAKVVLFLLTHSFVRRIQKNSIALAIKREQKEEKQKAQCEYSQHDEYDAPSIHD
jgi:hypothetical protein